MGIYVNPGNAAFEMSRFSELYVDKSMLISKMNAVYKTDHRFVCVSRPRRFGKSMAANMLSAYYSRGCDSASLFHGLKAESEKTFQMHLNRHHVIRLDIQQFLESRHDLDSFIRRMEDKVNAELRAEFPEYTQSPSRLKESLEQIFIQTKQGFIFIIDEWDCVFRVAKDQKEIQKDYLDFLRGLLKGQDYVELAYMTGILPIKKYGEHSAVNIFDEYSMVDCNSSVFGRTVTESNPLEVRFAKDWIHSWQNLHVLTYFAVNAKYWAELLRLILKISENILVLPIRKCVNSADATAWMMQKWKNGMMAICSALFTFIIQNQSQMH